MNTCSASKHTMLAPPQVLGNWLEHRPSNKNDLDSNVTLEVGRVYCTRQTFSFHFLSLLSCALSGTTCTASFTVWKERFTSIWNEQIFHMCFSQDSAQLVGLNADLLRTKNKQQRSTPVIRNVRVLFVQPYRQQACCHMFISYFILNKFRTKQSSFLSHRFLVLCFKHCVC
jgi:hypothetical protein